ncbi:MAG: TonB-dependent receptor, partial [Saprospiraceae bacterium]|nr:TonB-dependent receptor [Saprospiraceae bacterium]
MRLKSKSVAALTESNRYPVFGSYFQAKMIIAIALLSCSSLRAQSLADYRLDLHTDRMSLAEFIAKINEKIPGKIYTPAGYSQWQVGPLQESGALSEVLNRQLEPHGLGLIFHRNSVVIIAAKEDLTKLYTAQYYQALEESIAASQTEDQREIVIGSVDKISLTGETQIVGTVRDKETGEEVVGATLQLEGLTQGTATEADGTYQLNTKAGDYVLIVQYIGYQIERIPIKVISSGMLDIELERSTVLLDEVLVQAKARDVNIKEVQVGVTRVSTKQIEKLPTFLGEVDIIKGLLLQPGVTTLGEGSSGFNVRGGNVDQNLIMIDEGMIFNASHALGFFSSFNSDIVSEAILYKGTMPASYGGRLASALEVKVKDGSFDRWHLKGGLGLVSSRITLDGPLEKNKTSVLFAARSTYSNWLLRQVQVPEVQASSVSFYDLNFRLAHRFNEKNNLTLSAFITEDQFSFNNEFGFEYKTYMGQMQYRKVLGKKSLATTNFVWSRYLSEQNDFDGLDASNYQTGLDYLKIKENFNYLGDRLQAHLGVSAVIYDVLANSTVPTSEISLVQPESNQAQNGIEWSVYSDLDLEISPRLSLIGGLRYSIFQFLGPHDSYIYADPEKPTLEGLLEPLKIEDRIVKTYRHLQPRLSFRYNISASSSVKGGYGRTAQYINQIYNSETPTPTNFWQLSNQYVPAQLAHNFSLGYFHNFSDNLWVTSIEGFYRNIDQLFDYREFADLLVNDHLETELLAGIGRAYGVEMSVHRQVGHVHGWINYTYSRSERQIEGINRGNWYKSNFDKTHDLKLVTNLQINKRNSISINFTFATGRPITVPVSKYVVQNRVVVLDYS